MKAPADLDTLKELIAKRYDSLSGRLQQVAEFCNRPADAGGGRNHGDHCQASQRTIVDLESIL
ncbi:hypothetical protein OGZ01_19930 [Vibrio harveyi]|nr:hypothetical protein [Vibrio harveyi]